MFSDQLPERVSREWLSIHEFKDSNKFDHKTPLHYMAEKGSIKALDWLVKTVYSSNVTELLADLLNQYNELKQSACQIALANNQQPFLRQFFCLAIQKMVIQQVVDTISRVRINEDIHRLFLNHTNENEIYLLPQALSQGVIDSLEETNDLDGSIKKLKDFLRTPAVTSSTNSLLGIMTQNKQRRFFWDLLNNSRSRGLVLQLFENNPSSLELMLQDNYNPNFLNVLIEQLTDVQFQSLFLTNLYNEVSHTLVDVYQKAIANNQQAFLRRLFRLEIQQILGSVNRPLFLSYLESAICQLFANYTNENKVYLLTHALSQGIIDCLENASEFEELVNSQVARFLVGSFSGDADSLLDIIIQHKQWHFFQDLLNNRSRELVFRLFENNPKAFELILQNN